MNRQDKKNAERDAAARRISEAVAGATGDDFFRVLVRELAGALGSDYTFVGELLDGAPDRIRTLAVYARGAPADNFEYDLAGTPCENVVGKTLCYYADGVQKKFPGDPMLAEMGVHSYAGTPLFDTRRRPLGIIVALASSPMEDPGNASLLLPAFAARASAELERVRMEQELRRREATLTSVLRAAPVGIGLVRNRVFQWVNDHMLGLLGYSRDELLGRSARLIYETDDEYERVGSVKYREIRERGTGEVDTVWKCKDGALVDMHLRSTPLDPTDLSKGVIFTAMDIMERKRFERGLREREQKYRRLIESIEKNNFLYSHDVNGNFTYISRSLTELLGYTPEEFTTHYTQYLTDNPANREAVRRTEQSILGNPQPPYELETRHKNGGTRWLEVSEIPVIDEHGGVVAVEGIARDVTERKRAEGAQKLTEKRLAALLALGQMTEASLEETAAFVLEKAVGLTSSAFGFVGLLSDDEKIYTAYAMSQAVMKDCAVIKQPLHFAVDEAGVWAEAVRTNEPVIMNDYASPHTGKKGCPEGHVPLTRLLSIPLLAGRRVVGVAAVANKSAPYDDTDVRQLTLLMDGMWRHIQRKRLEDELLKTQKLESVGLLAGGLAHDFNNLLTGILGNIELAKMFARPGDRVSERLDEASKAFYRAKDLTQQLLTFSKGGEPVKRPVNAGEIVREAATFSSRGSNVRCEFAIPEDVPPVEADAGQISQVINNLVINACQAMPAGGVLSLRCETAAVGVHDALPLPPGPYVRITVQDRGIGIPKEHLSKIFDPFFTTKQTGSGLGLATSYSIIKKHHGYITVESELGAGTAFHVYLPALAGKPPARQAPDAAPVRGEGRVLVMDDEEIIRTTAGEMLKVLGYDPAFAKDGAEAVALYAKAREDGSPFAAVVMDVTVPGGMGGLDAVNRLLALDPGARVIVSSGYSGNASVAEYGKYGFAGMVTKPYRIKELAEAVHRAIAGGTS